MASHNGIAKLREHLMKLQNDAIDASFTDEELEVHASSLNKSLQSLQKQVKQHETILKKLREGTPQSPLDDPSSDPGQRLQQLRTVASAYHKLAQTDPALPSAESPLPALLAVRTTLNLINQSKAAIRDTNERLVDAQNELRREDQSLKDARYLTSALHARIENLRVEESEQAKKKETDIVSSLILKQQHRKLRYAKGMRGLVRAFNKFVIDHLAVMLAGEDLGGPVAGDSLDLTEDSLKGGFTHQGKAKKPAAQSGSFAKKRYQRNAQIWGDDHSHDDDGEPRSEKGAAAAAFLDLTENLLNANSGDDEASPYVQIPKEDAAVKFLVRAKVAQFHPQDAGKLRLLNFGTNTE